MSDSDRQSDWASGVGGSGPVLDALRAEGGVKTVARMRAD